MPAVLRLVGRHDDARINQALNDHFGLPLRIGQTVTIKTRTGPPQTGKGTLIGVRIQPDDLATLDSWIIDDGRGLTRPKAIRRLVEMALSNYAPRPGTRNSVRATKAAELASKVIDKHLDPDIPAEERDVRRRELLHGPSGFRDVRKDHAG
jgi:hypothetical protein